jgi:POT family proton-dependent oligopeptide transporter
MGINVGALLAPLVCGFLAQSDTFKRFLVAQGFDPATSWHWGFGAAGVGMVLGLVIYLLNLKRLQSKQKKVAVEKAEMKANKTPLTASDWKRVGVILIFFVFTILFWAAYEQKGASLNLLAKDLVRTEFFGYRFPSSYLQSCTPLFVIILAPIFSYLWVRMGKRQPSSPAKFTLGLFFISLAYFLLVPAVYMTAYGKISPLWLVGLYFLEVVGEMCLSPVGLSTVTKLSPARLVGIMMGVWFLASSFGSKLAGYFSGFYVPDAMTLVKLYGSIAVGLLISAALLALLTPKIKKMMGGIH